MPIGMKKEAIPTFMYLLIEQSAFFIFKVAPLRLMVMKNGVRDITKAVAVVGPDLTNVSI